LNIPDSIFSHFKEGKKYFDIKSYLSSNMKKKIISGIILIVVFILIAFCSCCTTKSSENTNLQTITPDEARYFEGDVLSGNMTLAGYDTPDYNISRYRVVILAYQPESDTYVYTFVEPLINGTYQYVLPESWESRFGREKKVFESYGLKKTGNMTKSDLWKVS